MSSSERRAFNDLERGELLRLANGRCRVCGGPIALATMEADHVLPHVAGGVTDVMNGQALCRTCNRRKGGDHAACGAGSDVHAAGVAGGRGNCR